jgi:prepilin-type N-terminal cleavage/methylation domain-containing protein
MNPSLPADSFRDRGAARPGRPARAPAGITLLELVVVLAVMGLAAALVAPATVTRVSDASTLTAVVDAGRANAIGRAQSLALTVGATGEWALRPLPPDDSVLVLAGVLEERPPRALRIILGPLGNCTAMDASGASLAWDAVRCRPLGTSRP